MSVGLAKYRIRLTVKRTEQKAFILSTLGLILPPRGASSTLSNLCPGKGKYLQIFRATIKPVYTADGSLSPLKRAGTPRFYVLLLLSFRSPNFPSAFSRFNVCRNEIFTTVFCHIYYVDIFNYEIPTFSLDCRRFQSIERHVTNGRVYVKGNDR